MRSTRATRWSSCQSAFGRCTAATRCRNSSSHKQKWAQPVGACASGHDRRDDWGTIDPLSGSRHGAANPLDRAAEVVDALARLPDSAEAKAVSARTRSPLFALQASFEGRWSWPGSLWPCLRCRCACRSESRRDCRGLIAVSAMLVAAMGAVRRARDASVRSRWVRPTAACCRNLVRRAEHLFAAAATALFAWQLATSNGVTFVAQQDVELIHSERPGDGVRSCPKGRRAAANRAAGGDAVHHLSGSERTRG